MFRSFIQWKNERKGTKALKSRSLRLETLEKRELLSVAPWDTAAEPASETAVYASVEGAPSLDLSALAAETVATAAEPRTLTVTTELDVVDATDELTSLREAIADAQAGDAIVFAADLAGQTITLDGQLEISKSLTINASDANITIDADDRGRAFYIAEKVDVTLEGLTITGGRALRGGGVFVDVGADAKFVDCLIVGNAASGAGEFVGGAGVYVYSANATFEGCVVAENKALDGAGGGVYVFGSDSVTSFEHCTVAKNEAYDGGGLYVRGESTVRNTIVAKNEGKTFDDISGVPTTDEYNLIGADPQFNADLSLSVKSWAIGRASDGGSIGAIPYVGAVAQETPKKLVVTTADDVVDATDGKISLREAILYAEYADDNDAKEITFSDDLNGKTIALNGDELRVSKALKINAGKQNITIDAQEQSRVFFINGGTQDNPVELTGLNLIKGKSATYGGGVYTRGATNFTECSIVGSTAAEGAGVYAYMGIAKFNAVTISGNVATTYGGGVFAHSVNTTFVESVIFDNEATFGGGLVARGMTTVDGGEISGNVAAEGGGVYVYSGTSAFNNVKITGNTATVVGEGDKAYGGSGGGVYADVTATFDGGEISGNVAAYGGGVYLAEGATLTGGTITGNKASTSGGGVYVESDAILTGGTITRNEAKYGGGVYFYSGRSTIASAVELSGNKATFGGGGVYLNSGAQLWYSHISGTNKATSGGNVYLESEAALVNCAVSGGEATYGGGVYANENAVLLSCTTAGNSATYDGSGVYSLGAILVNTIVAENYWHDFYGFLSPDSKNNLIGFDPKFVKGPVFENGKLTNADELDLNLSAGSWAIGRAFGGGAIGAFQYVGDVGKRDAPSLVVTTNLDVVDDTDGKISLREALLYAEAGDVITFADDWADKTIADALTGQTIKLDGQLYVWQGVKIDAEGKDITIDAGKNSRVFHVSARGADVKLADLTLTGGKSIGDGGGVLVYSGALKLDGVTVSDNNAANVGGGVYLNAGASLSGGAISGNVAAYGGGVFVDGDATLTSVSIIGNAATVVGEGDEAYGGDGGGLCVYAGSVALSEVAISGNNAANAGGGVYLNAGASLSGGAISDNNAKFGGGVYLAEGATLTGGALTGNAASTSGGGVYLKSAATLQACQVGGANDGEGNVAVYGGGVFVDGDATLTSVSIIGNAATVVGEGDEAYGGDGGGLYVYAGSVALSEVAISGNNAAYGGGAYLKAGATLTGGAISGNVAAYGGGAYLESAATLENCQVGGASDGEGNAAAYGGGVYVENGATLTSVSVVGNEAAYGGGVFVNGDATLTSVSVVGNEAMVVGEGDEAYGGDGGGLYVYAGSVALSEVAISGNNAAYGGGAYLKAGATLTGGALTGNAASTSGGGVYLESAATLQACQVGGANDGEENSAAYGGGVLVNGDATLTSVSVVGNEATYGGGLYVYAGSVALSEVAISGNVAAYGGGAYLNDNATLTGGALTGNAASTSGGGVYLKSAATLQACQVGGANDGEGNSAAYGGGVYVENGATLIGGSISGNSATSDGGGVYVFSGEATLTDVAVSGNEAKYGGGVCLEADASLVGGAIANNAAAFGGGVLAYGDATLTDVAVSNNKATVSGDYGGFGGGLYVVAGVVELSGATSVSGNNAAISGGGAYVDSGATLSGGSISGNVAAYGGGVYAYDATLADVTVSGNSATMDGGGVYAYDATLADVTVSGNSATKDGGGVYAYGASLSDVAVSGNSATKDGGGVYAYNASLSDVAVSGNSATKGGGVYVESGATLTGVAVSDNEAASDGGGVYVFSGETTLSGGSISDNSANSGGGVYLASGASLFGGSISDNSANSGGGVYLASGASLVGGSISGNSANYGGGVFASGASLSDVAVSGNSATKDGGGVYAYGASLSDVAVSGNSATKGGGVYVESGATLAGVAVSGNEATYDGGGVYVFSGEAALTDVAVSGNEATYSGGGVYLASGASLVGGSISGNSANYGGGVYAYGATLTGVTISGNAATANGGGVYAYGASLANVEVSANKATLGGGVYVDGAATLTNVTVAGNTATTYGGVYVASGAATLYNTIVALNWGGDFFGSTDGENNMIGADPKFVDAPTFDATGTPTNDSLDLRLTQASWAIDAGKNDYVVGTTDLDGADRVAKSWAAEATVDLGAYEYQGEFANADQAIFADWNGSAVVTTNADVVDSTDGQISLREALLYAEWNDVALITFDAALKGATITLNGTELYVLQGVKIDAEGKGITIDANGESRVFFADGGTEETPIGLVGLTLAGGKATDGAALYVRSGVAALTSCSVVGNEAENGAGLYVYSGAATLANSLIAENNAKKGGGVYVASGAATLANCTTTANEAEVGGGIYVEAGAATLRNAIVVLNSASVSDGDVYVAADATVDAYNALSTFDAWTNASASGVVNYLYDASQPLFKDAANGDYTLAPLSQAIEVGNNDYAVDVQGNPLTTDLAGRPRFVGVVDLGAYEAPPAAPTELAFGEYNPEGLCATLSWNDAATNEDYYEVRFSVDGGDWSKSVKLNKDTDAYLCKNLVGNTSYIFQVRAVANDPNDADDYASDWVEAEIVIPANPENVKFGPYDASTKSATLTWDDKATNEVAYQVRYRVDGGGWSYLANLDKNAASRVCGGLGLNKLYEYQIRAVSRTGHASAWGGAEIAVPAAPSAVAFLPEQYDASTKTATLTWDDKAKYEETYEVRYRVVGGEEWTTETFDASATTSRDYVLEGGATYEYQIRAISTTGHESAWSAVATVAVPAEPTDVSFAQYDPATKTATLTWADTTNETKYEVRYRVEGGEWTTADDLAKNAKSARYVLDADTTYEYQIRAVTATGHASAWVDATIDVPAEPTGVAFGEFNTVDRGATLTWNDTAKEVRYEVRVRVNGGGWSYRADLDADTTSRLCGGLLVNQTYEYQIRAVTATGHASAWVGAEIAVPAAPTNVKFNVYDASTHKATLSWTNNATNGAKYEVRLRVDGGGWSYLPDLDANETARVCGGLQVNKTYEYQIRLVSTTGHASAWVGDTVSTVPPADPTNVKFGEYDASAKTATLSWTDAADDEVRYEVRYRVDGGAWASMKNLAANATSRLCGGLGVDKTYEFQIRAVAASGLASAWVGAELSTVSPAAPTDVAFGAYDEAGKSATLTWTNNATNAVACEFRYSVDGGAWKTLSQTLPADAESRLCGGLGVNKTYVFQVRAVAASGLASDWVGAAIDTTAVVPLAPTDVKFGAYDALAKTATLTWTDNAANEAKYEIRYRVDGGAWNSLSAAAENATSRLCGGLGVNKTYEFQIRAVSVFGLASDWVGATLDTTADASATSAAALASEIFANPFDEFDFFAEEWRVKF